MKLKRQLPIPGKVYTLKEIEEALFLQDAPHLMVHIPTKGFHPIQTSHIFPKDMLAISEWANTYWEYSYTTREWIPIFHAASSEDVRNLCDVKESKHEFASDGDMWIVPKAFPRKEI